MSHPAFQKPDNLYGMSYAKWVRLAEQAEADELWYLAQTYWMNACNTSLSKRKSEEARQRAANAAKHLLTPERKPT